MTHGSEASHQAITPFILPNEVLQPKVSLRLNSAAISATPKRMQPFGELSFSARASIFCGLQTEQIFKRAKKTKFNEDSENMKRSEHVSLFTYKTIL
jgi:hypothetical protein